MKKIIFSLLTLVVLLVACEPKTVSDKFQIPAVHDVVMYQVNPRVFADSASLKAVTARIDSIADLGVNMIWVMPIYPIGEEKSKNSPYSIRDYKAIASEFGTIDDFKALVAACHERGMGLILDWVANHTAWDNVWLKDQGHKDWYTQDSAGNIIFPPGTDWTDVADLNYDNREMRDAMIDAMRYWIVEVGIDGFRCDVADQVPADFWKEAIDKLREEAGRNILMLAEGNEKKTFAAGFDMNYAWDFRATLKRVFAGDSVQKLIAADSLEYDSLPDTKVKLRFTTNHDESTKATPVTEFVNVRGSMAAFVATTYLHGGMLIYSSQEVGYPEPINFFNYVPVDWMANASLRSEYKLLVAVYNTHDALRSGSLKTYPDENVLVFEREKGNDHVLVFVNLRNEKHEVAVPKNWSGVTLNEVVRGEEIVLADKLTLEPFEYFVLTGK